MSENKNEVTTMLESVGLTVVDPFRWSYRLDNYFWLDFEFADIEAFVASIKNLDGKVIFHMSKPEEGWLSSRYESYRKIVTDVYLCLVSPNIIHRLVITESGISE
jgi:hypothetical protein